MKKINITLVDDHPMVVAGLVSLLKPYRHICIKETYSNGPDLLSGLKRTTPDVLLLDLFLPGQEAKNFLPEIKTPSPAMRILVWTSMDTPAMVNSMMRRGCNGYLLKGANAATLVDAIETVYNGDEYLDQTLKEVLFHHVINYKNQLPSPNAPIRLSQREKDILRLIAKEYTTREIADELFISFRTAENHRYNLIQKLDVKNTAGLVKIAIQMGLMGNGI